MRGLDDEVLLALAAEGGVEEVEQREASPDRVGRDRLVSQVEAEPVRRVRQTTRDSRTGATGTAARRVRSAESEGPSNHDSLATFGSWAPDHRADVVQDFGGSSSQTAAVMARMPVSMLGAGSGW